jgi:hypothetical protein
LKASNTGKPVARHNAATSAGATHGEGWSATKRAAPLSKLCWALSSIFNLPAAQRHALAETNDEVTRDQLRNPVQEAGSEAAMCGTVNGRHAKRRRTNANPAQSTCAPTKLIGDLHAIIAI